MTRVEKLTLLSHEEKSMQGKPSVKAFSPFQKYECPGCTRDLSSFVQSVEGTCKQMQEDQDKGRELSRYSCFFWIFCCCESELISLRML